MKRLLAILMALCMLVCFAACGNKPATTDPTVAPEEPTSETWKTKSANYEFEDSARLIFFQNYTVLNQDVAEDGAVYFPDFGDAMTPEDMTIAGESVKAYPLDRLEKMWCTKVTKDLTVIDNDGKTYTMPAADLAKAYVGEYETEVDGLAANMGVLKAGSLEVKGVKYILSGDGKDAFMFPTTGEIAADEPTKIVDIFEEIGWDANLVYRFVCFDKFWNYIDSQDKSDEDGEKVLAGTELRATLSGAINISIPFENRGGSGKMNDIFFVAISTQVK